MGTVELETGILVTGYLDTGKQDTGKFGMDEFNTGKLLTAKLDCMGTWFINIYISISLCKVKL